MSHETLEISAEKNVGAVKFSLVKSYIPQSTKFVQVVKS